MSITNPQSWYDKPPSWIGVVLLCVLLTAGLSVHTRYVHTMPAPIVETAEPPQAFLDDFGDVIAVELVDGPKLNLTVQPRVGVPWTRQTSLHAVLQWDAKPAGAVVVVGKFAEAADRVTVRVRSLPGEPDIGEAYFYHLFEGPFRPRPPAPPVPDDPADRVVFDRVRAWAEQAADRRVENRLTEILSEEPDRPQAGVLTVMLAGFVAKVVERVLAGAAIALGLVIIVGLAKLYWHYLVGAGVAALSVTTQIAEWRARSAAKRVTK